MRLAPRGWAEFQHYHDRNPAWIKLHKKLLDDFEFQCLPVASRALAPMLWLIASESKEGIIDADPKKLGFRLRMTSSQVTDGLNPLIEGGFFSVVQDASGTLDELERQASLEREEEKKRREEENKRARARLFEDFWSICSKKVGKPKAEKAFYAALGDAPSETIIEGMRRYAATRAGEDSKFTLHPTTWLNQKRWLDEPAGGTGVGATVHYLSPEVQAKEQENLRKMGLA